MSGAHPTGIVWIAHAKLFALNNGRKHCTEGIYAFGDKASAEKCAEGLVDEKHQLNLREVWKKSVQDDPVGAMKSYILKQTHGSLETEVRVFKGRAWRTAQDEFLHLGFESVE
jgi:hypothetical protein